MLRKLRIAADGFPHAPCCVPTRHHPYFLLWSAPDGGGGGDGGLFSLASIRQAIHAAVAEAERAGEEERKKLVRQLQLRWHPGRCGRWQQGAGPLADGWVCPTTSAYTFAELQRTRTGCSRKGAAGARHRGKLQG